MTMDKTKKFRIKQLITFICITILLFTLFFLYVYCRQIFGDEAGDALLGKGVENGYVAMGAFFTDNATKIVWSIISIVIVIFLEYICFFIVNLCFKKTARKRTIGSLLRSLIKYTSVIVIIFTILGIWGVNVAAIVASLGVVALIIGIGCKTLVNDIVSGFFIVVDNYFQVGDKVVIDGFEGFIETIGLRTTKIKDWLGNLKSINNSLITSVVNLSRYTSIAEVTIDISFNEDLRRVEAILAENLPIIKERIVELEDLTYAGVKALDDCGVQLYFLGRVNEVARPPVQRKILRELYLLFAEKDVIIPFNQLVVNGPDPVGKPRATKQDIEASQLIVYGKPETDKKEKVSKKSKFIKAIIDATEVSEEE